MLKLASKLYLLKSLTHPNQLTHYKLIANFTGIKIKNDKKSSSEVYAELSEDYIDKYNQKNKINKESTNNKDNKEINNTTKQKNTYNKKINSNTNQQQKEQQILKIDSLKTSWLGNALQDDLQMETKQWDNEIDHETSVNHQQKAHSNPPTLNKNKSPSKSTQQEAKKILTETQKSQSLIQSALLKTKSFKKDITKNQHIDNSRKFLQISCNLFPKYQVDRIIAEIKEFCSKKDLNMPSFIGHNIIQNQKGLLPQKKSQQKKVQKQIKLIEKITRQRQKKLFNGVRKVLDQCLTDLQTIDNLLNLLSQSDPYLMNNQGIQKLIYSHQEGAFQDEAGQHKAEINVILDKKQRKSLLNEKDDQKTIDQLLQAKKDFIKQSQEIINKPFNKKQKTTTLEEQSQQDLINVFEQFSISTQNEKDKKNKLKSKQKDRKQQKPNELGQKQKDRQDKKLQRNMRLIVKKNLNKQSVVPEQFEINEHSLHQIERILFKNKKIVEDNVVFKKIKNNNKQSNTTAANKLEKQCEQFGRNWVYGYQMSYSLSHQNCQQLIDYISVTYGDIVEYYIFPYKNMLQKRQNIMIHIQNQKRMKTQSFVKEYGPIVAEEKQSVADKLLDKIQKQKNLRLNKSSMVFKFRTLEAKQKFMLPQMRLYGINFKAFRNVRFEQAQSKKIIAISMIPWGCSSQDLLRSINKALKPIDVEVSYQACILAKGFIFVEFDNFYESLNACRLLNNLSFQGHNLKVQINYGSSKIYGEKYKNALEFDHYENLVKKLKDIKCFYNEVYQD